PPAELIRRRGYLVERRAAQRARRDRAKRLVHGRRPDPVRPGAAALRARRRERRAVDLLGVEAVAGLLRIALADRQRAGERLGRELVPEADLVAQRVGGHEART